MKKKRILYISQEITPYLSDSIIGRISKNLPKGAQERGYEIRSFMPNYGCINERRNQLHEVIRLSGMLLNINDQDNPLIVKVATLSEAKMQVYFIENKELFHLKTSLYKEDGTLHNNNVERAVFFARGVFETVKKLRWMPDIIHCQGWFTAMVPLYWKHIYKDEPLFKNTKIVFSLYNEIPEQVFAPEVKDILHYDKIPTPKIGTEGISKKSFMEVISEHIDGLCLCEEDMVEDATQIMAKAKVPILVYSEEEVADKAVDFYNSLCPDK